MDKICIPVIDCFYVLSVISFRFINLYTRKKEETHFLRSFEAFRRPQLLKISYTQIHNNVINSMNSFKITIKFLIFPKIVIVLQIILPQQLIKTKKKQSHKTHARIACYGWYGLSALDKCCLKEYQKGFRAYTQISLCVVSNLHRFSINTNFH